MKNLLIAIAPLVAIGLVMCTPNSSGVMTLDIPFEVSLEDGDAFPDDAADDATPETSFSCSDASVACTTEGKDFNGKSCGEDCCLGLMRAVKAHIDLMSGQCRYNPPDDILCIACGDSICGTSENFCNCPQDCPLDAGADED